MKPEPCVYFDFTRLGYPHWIPVTQTELEILWEGSHNIIAEHDAISIQVMLEITRRRLRREARRQGWVSPEWVTTAVMTQAIGGQLGEDLLPYTWDPE